MSINVLNKNQRRALASMMKCRTVSKAAADCGLSERTLGRYLSDPHLRKELDRRESVLIDEAGHFLIQGQKKALSEFSNLMIKARTKVQGGWLLLIGWSLVCDFES